MESDQMESVAPIWKLGHVGKGANVFAEHAYSFEFSFRSFAQIVRQLRTVCSRTLFIRPFSPFVFCSDQAKSKRTDPNGTPEVSVTAWTSVHPVLFPSGRQLKAWWHKIVGSKDVRGEESGPQVSLVLVLIVLGSIASVSAPGSTGLD